MRRRRRLLLIFGVLLLVGLAAFQGCRSLLASQYVANKVMARLSKTYGVPVTLKSVNLGFRGTSIRDLRLYAAGQEARPPAEPWLVVDQVDTDLTLWQALRGQTNLHHLTLKGTSVTLHFAADGRLLTQLPLDEGSTGAMPEVRLVDGRAVLRQDGRPPMTLAGIDANVHTEADALVLAGRIDDSDWGDWTIKGDWNVKTKKGSAALQSSRTHLTQTRVEEVPLVPASIWRKVNALEGDTRAGTRREHGWARQSCGISPCLEPIRTHIAVPSIELSGELTGGTIIVKDSLVGLRGVVAHTADGELDISGALDFRDAKRTRLQFDIVAKQLALTKLPSSWDLPREITGNLDGKAHLQLIIENGQVHTSGEGSGVVANAHVAGFPGRVELKITPAGKGFHFGKLPAVTLQRGEALPDARAVLAANADLEPLDWLSQVPARMVNELAQGIHLLSRSIVKTGQTMRGLVVKREPAPARATRLSRRPAGPGQRRSWGLDPAAQGQAALCGGRQAHLRTQGRHPDGYPARVESLSAQRLRFTGMADARGLSAR